MTNLIGGISLRGCIYYELLKVIMIRGWFFPVVYDEIEVYSKEGFLGKCEINLRSQDVYNNIQQEEAKNCRFLYKSEIDISIEDLIFQLVIKKDGKVIKVINDIKAELSCIEKADDNNNLIIGEPLKRNASIFFRGTNNILFCEDNVMLSDSIINFRGSNSLIYFGGLTNYKLEIDVYNNSVVCFGRNNAFSNKVKIISSEHQNCFVGDNCIFSTDIFIRNSDAHLMYSCETGKRTNFSKSVYIGDHVWIGQSVIILKGTEIDSGSIIGAGSVVSGKKIPHNTVWAGNPCKQISKGVFWDKECLHDFTEEMTTKSMNYLEFLNERNGMDDSEKWIFKYLEGECIKWEVLEENLSTAHYIDKCKTIYRLNHSKNRFVHSI